MKAPWFVTADIWIVFVVIVVEAAGKRRHRKCRVLVDY
jgi:hypothetical protein